MRIYAICNPTAGHGLGKKTGMQILEALQHKKIHCHLMMTDHPGHASALAQKAVQEGAQMVLAIGGDGTAHETAQGLMGTGVPLGIIPAGTGNDFIKTLGLPKEPLDALEYILKGTARETDIGMINGRLFLNEIGTGFDVMALDYTLKVKRFCRGILPYFYGVLQALFRFRSMDLTFSVDGGEEIRQKAFVMEVANGGHIGGGIRIAPNASVDDGLMDVVVVGHIRRRDLPFRLMGLMQGKILSFPETKFYRAKQVTFSVPDMRLNIDGEVISAKRAEVGILPGALLIRR